jgi:hypothetical protein
MGRKLNSISDEIAVEALTPDLANLKSLSKRGAEPQAIKPAANGFLVYVVDEKAFPLALPDHSDRDRYEALVARIKSQGVMHARLKMDFVAFAGALERIDAEMGGTSFLPVLACNNSPHNLLGDHGDCACLGYFNPAQTAGLNECLGDLAPAIAADLGKAGDAATRSVFDALRAAAQDAARRGDALAILHDEYIHAARGDRDAKPLASTTGAPSLSRPAPVDAGAKRPWWKLG